MSDYEKAIREILRAYNAKDWEKYESLIEEAYNRFNKAKWIIEDDAAHYLLV